MITNILMSIQTRFGLAAVAFLATTMMAGCGSSSGGGGVQATASFLNGVTSATSSSKLTPAHQLNQSTPAFASPANGTWYLSLDKMTVTITGINFYTDPNNIGGSLSNLSCKLTFDRSLPSLAHLANCSFTVTPGDYTGVSMAVSNSIQLQIYDQTNGFFTTSASTTNPITTTDPGSPQTITLDTNNCTSCPAGGANVTTYNTNFGKTVHVDSSTTLYVVLDPSQWLYTVVSGGAVTSNWTSMKSGVSLPVIASTSSVSKAELYNNSSGSGAGSTNTAGITNPIGMHIYFSDATTPARVDIRYGVGTASGSICSVFNSSWPSNPLPFASQGTSEAFFGIAGWLGEDSNKNISWVEGYDSTGPDWSKLVGVFSLQDVSSSGVGATSTLTYLCNQNGIPTSTYPAGYTSTGGPNYSVGAPTLTGGSTLTLHLQGD